MCLDCRRYRYVRAMIVISLLLLYDFSFGLTYWIAPDPERIGGGDGSIENPYRNFQTAVKEKGGGNTYVFKDGVYTGKQIYVYAGYRGVPQQPTVLRAETKYGAIIHGSVGHGIYVYPGADWVIIDGFQVSGSIIDGIKSNANYTVIRNCWVHNNLSMGISAHNVKGTVFERNLVEYNGAHIQFEHGFYVDGSNLTFDSNIIRFNASAGLHLYPNLTDSLISNNLIYGNARFGLLVWGKDGSGRNRVLNNTIVMNSGGLNLCGTTGDIICNNIIYDNAGLWKWSDTRCSDVEVSEYKDPNSICMKANLYESVSGVEECSRIMGLPQFERAVHGWFWLKKDSSAIGVGTSEYYARKDFYGYERNPDRIDLGCFCYEDTLLDKKYRKSWYLEWPYNNRISGGGMTIPDLWAVPEAVESAVE